MLQFGVGFYSAFLVSDRVTVETRSHADSHVWQWEAEAGAHSYKVRMLCMACCSARGQSMAGVTCPLQAHVALGSPRPTVPLNPVLVIGSAPLSVTSTPH